MRIRNLIAAVTFASFSFATASAHAATEMYVQYQDHQHRAEKLEVEAMTWDVLPVQVPGVPSASAGLVTLSFPEMSSPQEEGALLGMMQSALPNLVLKVQTATSTGTTVVTYTFQNATIANLANAATTTDVVIAFTNVVVTAETEQPAPGPTSGGGWNRVKNDPSSTTAQ